MKQNDCRVSDPDVTLSSTGEDVGEDIAIYNFSEDVHDTIGRLSPTGSIHFIEKFDISSLLKTPDKDMKVNGIPFNPSALKCRHGLLQCVRQPSYTIVISSKVGWMVKPNFKECFGYDYDNDLPTIKQTNITKVVYPIPGSKEMYRWGNEKHSRHSEDHVHETKVKAAPMMEPTANPLENKQKVKAGKKIKSDRRTWLQIQEEDVIAYGQKAVKSSFSPMYKLWAKLDFPREEPDPSETEEFLPSDDDDDQSPV